MERWQKMFSYFKTKIRTFVRKTPEEKINYYIILTYISVTIMFPKKKKVKDILLVRKQIRKLFFKGLEKLVEKYRLLCMSTYSLLQENLQELLLMFIRWLKK